MRKAFYVLLGLVLLGGAAGTFGVRYLGWEPGAMLQSDRGGPGAFSRERGGGFAEGRRWSERGRGRDRGGSAWLSFATVLDVLNVVVGLIGIVLTISGLRMQRNAMQMSMRGRD
jgi:hypothetical protein